MALGKLSRQELIALIDEFRDLPEGYDRLTLKHQLEEELPLTDVLNLCHSDLSSATIAEVCLRFEQTQRILSQRELVALVEAILAGTIDSEAEEILLIETFVHNCHHPAKTDLLFYPESVLGLGHGPTADMIVEKAICGR